MTQKIRDEANRIAKDCTLDLGVCTVTTADLNMLLISIEKLCDVVDKQRVYYKDEMCDAF